MRDVDTTVNLALKREHGKKMRGCCAMKESDERSELFEI